jgi:hypothetical protein
MICENRIFSTIAGFTVVAFLWSALLWPTIAVAQTATPPEAPPPGSASEIVQACDQASADAKSGHSGLGYGVGGLFCGVFGLIFAYSSNPQVPAEKLLGKSPDYVSTYTRCYKQEAKSKNVRASLIGWGIGVAIFVVVLVATADDGTTTTY